MRKLTAVEKRARKVAQELTRTMAARYERLVRAKTGRVATGTGATGLGGAGK